MVKKVGQIAFANSGGIGIQSKRIYDMLRPDKVLVVDTTSISKNKDLNLDWYQDPVVVDWPIRNSDIVSFVKGLDSVFMIENPYNFYLIHHCRELGIKTVCQTNYEFCENIFAEHLPAPDLFIMPSYWYLEEMQSKFNAMYLPPPIDDSLFYQTKITNILRSDTPRFLHVVGTLAFEDRNGTLDLIRSLKHSKEEFELVIHTQHPLPSEYRSNDSRLTIQQKHIENNSHIYENYDAMILPRRYGGLCLPMIEALTSGLPVLMTDISPNNKVLPKEFLIKPSDYKIIKIRSDIKCYRTDQKLLGEKLDEWAINLPSKSLAIKYSKFYRKDNLQPVYNKILRNTYESN